MSAIQFLGLLVAVSRARRSGNREAIAEAEKALVDADASKGYRRPSKFEPPLQPGQWAHWRRKWDEHGNPLVPGVKPRPRAAKPELSKRFGSCLSGSFPNGGLADE